MAMAIRDGHIDEQELLRRGDDTPPLMASVPEPPPSHWGKLTSQSRTLSPRATQASEHPWQVALPG